MHALFLGLALFQTPNAAYDKAIRWATAWVRRDPLDFSGKELVPEPQANWMLADEALHKILEKYGPKAATYEALGDCAMRRGRYRDARDYYEKALRLSTNEVHLRTKLRDAANYRAVAEIAKRGLPKEANVLGAIPLQDGRWAVLSALPQPYPMDAEKWPPHYTDFRIRVVVGKQLLQNLAVLPSDSEANESTLVMRNFDGDGKPELAIWTVAYGASVLPTTVTVYRDGVSLELMGQVEAPEGLVIRDIDHDGKDEIAATFAYGSNYEKLAHYQQPRWTDIYALSREAHPTYKLANERFPKEFLPIKADLERALKVRPSLPDTDVRLYQVRLCVILNDRKGAYAALQKAAADANLEYRTTNSDRQWSRQKHRDQLNEIAELRRQLSVRFGH